LYTSNIRESIMQRSANALLLVASAILVGACVTLAPGADQVRLTNKPADVGACKALGNIQVPRNDQGLVDGASAQTQFRNQAVGLGGNVALVTQGFMSIPAAGIAYHCP
jgi:hypothetical protein